MAKLRMAHASTHGARKPPGPIFFPPKKKVIFERFFYFLRPAFGHGRLGHPQSLEYSLIVYMYNQIYMSSVVNLALSLK